MTIFSHIFKYFSISACFLLYMMKNRYFNCSFLLLAFIISISSKKYPSGKQLVQAAVPLRERSER